MTGSVANEETEEFLSQVVWLYYTNNMTQSEIANQLGTTRLRINKAIGAARRLGMVRIELVTPFSARFDLQDKLKRRFDLVDAFVAPAGRKAYDNHLAVGTALAAFLDRGLSEERWRSIGISWGMTLTTAVERLGTHHLPKTEVVSMIGGTARGGGLNTFGVAVSFAKRINASYSLFAAPIYVETTALRDQLLGSSLHKDQSQAAAKVELAVLAAGDASPKSFLIRDGLPPDVKADDLVKCGAVGDVLGRFLNRDGEPIDHPINDRAIGIPLEALNRVPHVVLAAAGPNKLDIIKAAIKAGYIHTLITDDVTAELLVADA